MFEVTIVAEDVAGLISQMQTFISAFGGQATSSADTAKKDVIVVDKKDLAPADDKKAKQDQEGKETAEALKKAKDDALALARDVFSASKAGEAAIKKLPSEYGVKKLQDVPVEKAVTLLASVKAAQAATANA